MVRPIVALVHWVSVGYCNLEGGREAGSRSYLTSNNLTGFQGVLHVPPGYERWNSHSSLEVKALFSLEGSVTRPMTLVWNGFVGSDRQVSTSSVYSKNRLICLLWTKLSEIDLLFIERYFFFRRFWCRRQIIYTSTYLNTTIVGHNSHDSVFPHSPPFNRLTYSSPALCCVGSA